MSSRNSGSPEIRFCLTDFANGLLDRRVDSLTEEETDKLNAAYYAKGIGETIFACTNEGCRMMYGLCSVDGVLYPGNLVIHEAPCMNIKSIEQE